MSCSLTRPGGALAVAGDVDQVAAAPGPHLREELPDGEEVAQDVHAHHPLPAAIVLGTEVLERRCKKPDEHMKTSESNLEASHLQVVGAGVVDQDVRDPEVALHLGRHGQDLLPDKEVLRRRRKRRRRRRVQRMRRTRTRSTRGMLRRGRRKLLGAGVTGHHHPTSTLPLYS